MVVSQTQPLLSSVVSRRGDRSEFRIASIDDAPVGAPRLGGGAHLAARPTRNGRVGEAPAPIERLASRLDVINQHGETLVLPKLSRRQPRARNQARKEPDMTHQGEQLR